MKKVVIISIFLLFVVSLANATPPDVKYAGFAFSGNYKDIPVNFKYTNVLLSSTKDKDGRSIFDKEFLKFFQDNKSSIKSFNLLIGQDSNTKISMAVALTRENVSIVNIDDVYKVVVNICCNVILPDFAFLTNRPKPTLSVKTLSTTFGSNWVCVVAFTAFEKISAITKIKLN